MRGVDDGCDRDGTSMSTTEAAAVRDWPAAMRHMVRSRRALGRPHGDVRLWWEMFRPASLPPVQRENPGRTAPPAGDDTPEPAEAVSAASGGQCAECGEPTPVPHDRKPRRFCSTRCYGDYRTRHPEEFGIVVKPHGTTAAARRHQRMHESMCDECAEAWRSHRRNQRARARAAREAVAS